MNIRKILLSLAILVFAGSVVAGGTGAFFSDEERSDGNLFTAGSIDLKVDSEAHYNGMICEDVDQSEEIEVYEWHADGVIFADDDDVPVNNYPQPGDSCDGTWELTDIGPGYTFFSYEDLKPGDHGENTISLHVFENDAWACAVIDNMVDYENGCTEPEGEPEGTDATCSGDIGTPMSGAGDGELSSELHFFAWADDGNNEWAGPNDEPILFGNVEGPASDILGGTAYELFAPGLNNDAVLSADDVEYIGLYWCYGEISTVGNVLSCDGSSVDNTTQTDGLTADIMFYVEQARNNPGFTCPEPEVQEIDVSEDDGWAPNASNNDWFAKAKVQEAPNPASDFEVQVGIGDSNPADFDQGDTEYSDDVWTDFTLSYDGAGNASFTANGVLTSYAVGTDSYGTLGITLAAPSDGTTYVQDLVFSEDALSTDAASVSNGKYFLSFDADLNGAWTLTGQFKFDWGVLTNNGENQKVFFSID